MNVRPRAVFDCVLLQAMASPRGASGACVQRVFDAEVELILSPIVVKELRGVAERPKVAKKLRLNDRSAENFIHAIESCGTFVTDVMKDFVYPRDQSDAHYVDLAAAATANVIVTQDRDLLDLMDQSVPDGREFRKLFPQLKIVTSAVFVQSLRQPK